MESKAGVKAYGSVSGDDEGLGGQTWPMGKGGSGPPQEKLSKAIRRRRSASSPCAIICPRIKTQR
eukprot:169807-Amphidinium_carterae.1